MKNATLFSIEQYLKSGVLRGTLSTASVICCRDRRNTSHMPVASVLRNRGRSCKYRSSDLGCFRILWSTREL